MKMMTVTNSVFVSVAFVLVVANVVASFPSSFRSLCTKAERSNEQQVAATTAVLSFSSSSHHC